MFKLKKKGLKKKEVNQQMSIDKNCKGSVVMG